MDRATLVTCLDQAKELKEERCPKCRGLLFQADAEGLIKIKCRKCGYLVKRQLNRT